MLLVDKIKGGMRWCHLAMPPEGKDLKTHAESLEDRIARATVFNLSPLREMYVSKEGPFIASRDTFAGIPPYPLTWCETKWQNKNGDCEMRIGSLFETTPCGGITIFVPKPLMPDACGDGWIESEEDDEQRALVDAEYLINVTVAIELSGGLMTMHPTYRYPVGGDGRLLAKPALAQLPVQDVGRQMLEAFSSLVVRGHIAFFAFNLLSCKNVIETHNEIDRKLQKARRRRGKPPLTEYKTISIKVPASQLRSGSNSEAIEATHRRLHAVRGHFAEYSEERKLFGKHIGRFWIPAHVRGAEDAGAIVKGYQVKSR